MSEEKAGWTGGEGAEWEASNEYVLTRGRKGGHMQIGKALALRSAAAGSASKEQLANARMFAAAPKLLRALRKIVRVDEQCPVALPAGVADAVREARELLAVVMKGRG